MTAVVNATFCANVSIFQEEEEEEESSAVEGGFRVKSMEATLQRTFVTHKAKKK